MRTIVAKLVIGVAITTIGAFGADNSIGTWKRNIAKSKSTPPATNPFTSLTLVFEAIDGGVKETATAQRKDGTLINSGVTAKYDGKEYSVKGAMYKTISTRRADANTIIEIKKSGLFNQTVKNVYSEDGKTRTSIMKGTNAQGEPVSATLIFDKQ